MRYDPAVHHRRSLRLKGYNYADAGAYFVTICTRDKECLFGEVVDGEMRLNRHGLIVREEWIRSAQIRTEVELDEYVVMPNHMHAIVMISRRDCADVDVGATGRSPLQAIHGRVVFLSL